MNHVRCGPRLSACDGFFCLGAKLRSAEAWRAEDSATASDDASIFFRASRAQRIERQRFRKRQDANRQPRSKGQPQAASTPAPRDHRPTWVPRSKRSKPW